MKTASLISAIFSANAVRGAAMLKRDVSPNLEVQNFKAACTPRTVCSYSFELSLAGSDALVGCDVTEEPYAVGELPEVGGRACGGNSAYSWSAGFLPGFGLGLTVYTKWNSTANVTGTYPIPYAQIPVIPDGATEYQAYNGPTSFAVNAIFASA